MKFIKRWRPTFESLEARLTLDAESPTWSIKFTPAPPASLQPLRVAALGDSMTVESTGSYVQFLRQQFSASAFDATSFAGSGWKAETIREVWETQVRDAGYDAIIVFAGLPNLASSTANAGEIFITLKGLYEDAAQRGIHVISIGPSPWTDYFKWTVERQAETVQLNTLLQAYANEHDQFFHFVDAYQAFAMANDPHRLSARYGIGDGVHFSDVGDRYLAELVTPHLVEILPSHTVRQTASLLFSEPVTEILASHITLTRGTAPIDFQLTKVSQSGYQLEFDLADQAIHEISLALDASSVADLAGNALIDQPPEEFDVDYLAPFASLSINRPTVSDTYVESVTVTFNEDVTGLSVANFQLLSDRVATDLSGALLEVIDARTYRLRLPTAAVLDGNYELIFVPSSSVVDLHGNSAVRGGSIHWVNLQQAPQLVGNTLMLYSTRGHDTLAIAVGINQVEWAIGGVVRTFDAAGIDQVQVATGGGIDHVNMRVAPGARPITIIAESTDGLDSAFMYGSPGDDRWQAEPRQATLSSPGFQIKALGFIRVSAFSRGGSDQATLMDSTGDDRMDSRGWMTTLTGPGFSNLAFGFTRVTAVASTGNDSADIFDSPNDDVASVTPTQATLAVPGFTYSAMSFDRVNIRATQGNDRARLVGSSAAESYVGQTASSFWSGTGFAHYLYSFDEVEVVGGGGADRASLYDSPGNDRLEANTRVATLILPTVRLTTIDIARTNVYARSGLDTALFTGQSISETFVGQPTFASLTAGSFAVFAFAFDSVSAVGNGGNDVATFHDSTGDDLYVSSPTSANLSGPGYSLQADGYRRVNAYARSGNDLARMSTGPNVETLNGQSTSTTVTGPTSTNIAYGFDRVEAIGDASDTANLFDTGGNDTFQSNGSQARLSGANYDNNVSSFGRVNAFARVGNDTAVLNGTSSAETFSGRPSGSSLIGTGFAIYAYAFDTLSARGGGGADTATLNDSTGNDSFVASPLSSTLRGSGYQITVDNFPRVSAYASTGQDTAQLQGSAGNDIVVARPDYTSIRSSGYTILAKGFDSVATDGRGGNDTATFVDSSGDDLVTTGNRSASMSGAGFLNTVTGFARITIQASIGNDTILINGTAGDDTFTGDGATGRLATTGLVVSISGFDTVTLNASTQGVDQVLVTNLTYQLNVGLGWR